MTRALGPFLFEEKKMIKLETTGSFMLIDPTTRLVIEADGATEVPALTEFLQTRIDIGDLRIVEGEAKAAEAADLPFTPTARARNALDHDGDGKAGGSKPGAESTAAKGAARKRKGN